MIKTIVLSFVGVLILFFLLQGIIRFVDSFISGNRDSMESSRIDIVLGLFFVLVFSLIIFLF